MPVVAVLVGLVVGISLGALGAGGSILTVPALVYLLGQDPRAATTGSLIIVGLTAATGAAGLYRSGKVRLGQGLIFGVFGIAGSFLGSRLSGGVRPELLMSAFAGLMLVVAATMAYKLWKQARARRQGIATPDKPEEVPIITLRPVTCNCKKLATLVIAGTAVGLLTGFFGVGGGFAIVPALVLALGLSMPVAVGTSLVVIAFNSVSALLFRLGDGVQLDWAVIAWFTAFSIIGGQVGSRLARRVSPARLSTAFVVVLILIAGYTAAVNLPTLIG